MPKTCLATARLRCPMAVPDGCQQAPTISQRILQCPLIQVGHTQLQLLFILGQQLDKIALKNWKNKINWMNCIKLKLKAALECVRSCQSPQWQACSGCRWKWLKKFGVQICVGSESGWRTICAPANGKIELEIVESHTVCSWLVCSKKRNAAAPSRR